MTKGERWLDKWIEKIFQAPDPKLPRMVHCTLGSFMRLTKMDKIDAIKYLEEHATPLEYKGWYEVTLGKEGKA